MTDGTTTPIAAGVDLPQLERSLRQPRSLFSWGMSVVTGGMTIAALFPLFSVLYLLVVRGGHALSRAVFTELPPAALMPGGGFGNASNSPVLPASGALVTVGR